MAKVLPWCTGLEGGTALVFDYTTGTITVSGAAARTGSYGMNIAYNSFARADLVTPVAELYMGQAFQPHIAGGRLVTWYSETAALGYVQITNLKTVQAYVGSTLVASSSQTFPLTGFHAIVVRAKIDDAAGVIQVWVDGNLFIDYSGDTKPGADSQISTVQYGISSANSGMYDDIWLATSLISYDAKIVGLRPSADGDLTEWTAFGGGSHYEKVREIPPDDDTSYEYSTVSGNRALYHIDDLDGVGKTILGLNVTAVMAETAGSVGKTRILAKTGGTVYNGDDEDLFITYSALNKFWATNPDTGVAWADADVDALQIGVEDRS